MEEKTPEPASHLPRLELTSSGPTPTHGGTAGSGGSRRARGWKDDVLTEQP